MADYNTSKKTDSNTSRNISGTKNNHPKTVQETIKWLTEVLKRPPLPECPTECQRDCAVPEGKAPAYLNGNGKAHLVKWMPYQERMPRLDEIRSWFSKTKGIGTLGGWNGNHYIGFVDLDHKSEVFESYEAFLSVYENWMDSYPILKTAPRFKTPSGGYRVILAFTEAQDWVAFTLAEGMPRMGELLQKNGSHTLLPPSLSIEGKPYQWEHFTEYPPVVTTPQEVGIYPTRKNHSNANNDRPLRKTFSYIPGALRLEDLGSDKSRAVLNGEDIAGDRSESLTVAAREWYGWENFCRKNSLVYNGTTEGLAAYAWSRLDDGKDPDKWERILKTVDPDSHTAAEHMGGDESCWKKIKRLAPDQYEKKRPQQFQHTSTHQHTTNTQSTHTLNTDISIDSDESVLKVLSLTTDRDIKNFESLSTSKLSVFRPYDYFPQSLAKEVIADAKLFNIDPLAIAQYLLPCVSSLLGKTWIDFSGFRVPTILWTMTIHRSGKGKSRAKNVVSAPLDDWQIRESNRYKEVRKDWKNAEEKRKKRKDDSGDSTPEPTQRKYVFNQVTPQALVRNLANQETNGCVWIRDELKGLFKSLDQFTGEGEGLDVLVESWDGKACMVDRVDADNSYVVPESRLSIAGGLQPGTYSKVFSDPDDPQGVQARFLIGTPMELPVKRVKGASVLVSSLDSIYYWIEKQDWGTLTPTVEADDLFTFILESIGNEPTPNDACDAWVSKLPGQILRLCAPIHALECYYDRSKDKSKITLQTLEKAYQMGLFYQQNFYRLQGVLGTDGTLSGLLLKIVKKAQSSPTGVALADLYRNINGIRALAKQEGLKVSECTERLCQQLEDLGKGRLTKSGKSIIFSIHNQHTNTQTSKTIATEDFWLCVESVAGNTQQHTATHDENLANGINTQSHTSANNVSSIAVPSGERREGSRIGNASLSQNGHTCLPEESGTGSGDDGEVLERSECTVSEGSRNGHRGDAGQNASGENSIKKVQTGDLSRSKENAERSPEAKEANGNHSPIQPTQLVLAVGQQAIDQRNGKVVTVTKIDGEWIDFDGDHLSGTTHCSNLTPLPETNSEK